MNFFIAASVRTGSTYMAKVIGKILDKPCREYLNFPPHRKEEIGEDGGYEEKIIGLLENNNAILKIVWRTALGIKEHYPNLFDQLMKQKAILIDRRDKVYQAISHFSARESGNWGGPYAWDYEYDFEKLYANYQLVCMESSFWRNHLQNYTLVYYEDIFLAPHAVGFKLENFNIGIKAHEFETKIEYKPYKNPYRDALYIRFMYDLEKKFYDTLEK